MITLNTDGNPISQAFIDNIRSASPRTIARLVHNGAFIDCAIVSVTVTKGCCGSEELTLGGVVGDCLTAEVKNMDVDIKGKEIECWFGALVDDETSEYEYISVGKFLASEVKKTRYQKTITAYSGVVSKTSGAFDYNGLDSHSIADIVAALEEQLGCTITCDESIDTSLEIDFIPAELTHYSMLGVVATACGGYVVNTNDGGIVVKQYDATPTLDINTGMTIPLPEFEEEAFTVNGVICTVDGGDLGDGQGATAFVNNRRPLVADVDSTEYDIVTSDEDDIVANTSVVDELSLTFSCEYMTSEVFIKNVSSIIGYSFYPSTANLVLGDPRLEGRDVLNVTDVDGTEYIVPCHRIVHTYKTGIVSQIIAVQPTMVASDIGTTLPVSTKVERAERLASEAYGIAADTNQYFWFTSKGTDTGAHITEVPQSVFLADPEHGGGNLLARSSGLALRNGLTELATFSESGVRVGAQSNFNLDIGANKIRFVDGASNREGNIKFESFIDEGGDTQTFLVLENSSHLDTADSMNGIMLRALMDRDDGSGGGGTSTPIFWITSQFSEEGRAITWADFVCNDFTVEVDKNPDADEGTDIIFDIISDEGAILSTTMGADSCWYGVHNQDTFVQVNLGVGTGGVNHGVYSYSDATWLIYMNGDSNAVIPRAGQETVSSAANLNVTSGGLLRRYASSSRRYKKEVADIKSVDVAPENLYDARVVQFKYKNDYLHDDDVRYGQTIPGFIVEELEEVYPIAVDYDDGLAEDWNVRYLLPPMLSLIQKQKKSIDKLEERIEKLEEQS